MFIPLCQREANVINSSPMKPFPAHSPETSPEDDLNEIADHLADIADPTAIRQFFAEILTPRERSDIASRWRLMKLLLAGRTQRSIAAELGLSLCKITRGSRELKRPDSICRQLITKKQHPQ